jgi:hypothetical protein
LPIFSYVQLELSIRAANINVLKSLLLPEKGIRRRADILFSRHVGFKPRDFFFQERDSLAEFARRQQREILPEFVNEFLLRLLLVIKGWHGILQRGKF